MMGDLSRCRSRIDRFGQSLNAEAGAVHIISFAPGLGSCLSYDTDCQIKLKLSHRRNAASTSDSRNMHRIETDDAQP
jgi:hypothetical protein